MENLAVVGLKSEVIGRRGTGIKWGCGMTCKEPAKGFYLNGNQMK